MNCDVGEQRKGWKMSSFSNLSITSPTSQLIFQPFRRFAYVTAHSPTLPSLYLRHSSFSNPSVYSPTSQLIHQPFYRFSYATSSSLNSPGEPPMPFFLSFFLFPFHFYLSHPSLSFCVFFCIFLVLFFPFFSYFSFSLFFLCSFR